MKQYHCTVQLKAQLGAGSITRRKGEVVLNLTDEQAKDPSLISKEFLNLPENLHPAIPRWIVGKIREAYQVEKVLTVNGPLGLNK